MSPHALRLWWVLWLRLSNSLWNSGLPEHPSLPSVSLFLMYLLPVFLFLLSLCFFLSLCFSLCTSSHLSFNSISPSLTFTLFCCFPIFSFCTMKLKCVLKHFAHLLALCCYFLCTILSS